MDIRTLVNRSAMSIALLAVPAGHGLSYAADGSPSAGSPAEATEAEIPQAWPEAVGVASAPLLRMSEWIRDGKLDVRSLLVIKDGKLIFERYGNGLSRDYNHELYSVTKTVTSLLTGILVGERKLSVEQKIAPFLAAAYPEFEDALADKQGIELRHLMSMASGLYYKTTEGTDPLYYLTPNRLKLALGTQARILPETLESTQASRQALRDEIELSRQTVAVAGTATAPNDTPEK